MNFLDARLPRRFWKRCIPEPNSGCWMWLGFVKPTGYATFPLKSGRPISAHRFSFRRLRGPIPDGLTLDHVCENKSCVNPAHLDPCTGRENTRRYYQRLAIRRAHGLTVGIPSVDVCKPLHDSALNNSSESVMHAYAADSTEVSS